MEGGGPSRDGERTAALERLLEKTLREWERLGSGFEAPSRKGNLNRRTEMTLPSKNEAERLKGCRKGGAQPNRRKGALVGDVG